MSFFLGKQSKRAHDETHLERQYSQGGHVLSFAHHLNGTASRSRYFKTCAKVTRFPFHCTAETANYTCNDVIRVS